MVHLVGVTVSVVSDRGECIVNISDCPCHDSVWYEAVTVGRPQVPEKDQQVRDNKVYPSEVSDNLEALIWDHLIAVSHLLLRPGNA